MAILETKYSVGDVVYWATTISEKRTHPCPDCGGTKKWKAISPAGGEYEFDCPRCATGYRSRDGLGLEYLQYTAHAVPLTIGSVRVDTAPFSGDDAVSYMCRETGIGGGSVYRESDLFLTKEAALEAAAAKAAGQNMTVPHIVEAYNRTLEVKDYQLDSAVLALAKKTELNSKLMLYNLDDLFAAINEAEDLDAVKEAADDYRQYSMKRDLERAGIASPADAINAVRADLAELAGRV